MNYKFSNHAFDRFNQRISIEIDDFFDYLDNKSVIQMIEKNGTKQLVIFIQEQKEFFIVVISKDTIISIMPSIWRSKGISDVTMEEARRLSGEVPTVISSEKHLTLYKSFEYAIIHKSFSKHLSRTQFIFKTNQSFNCLKIEENKQFVEQFYRHVDEKNIDINEIDRVKVKLSDGWSDTNEFYKQD